MVRTQRVGRSVRVGMLTVAEIAERTGLRLNTVYRRWLRGWPVERLGEVPHDGPTDRVGGSVDLEDRRGTLRGRRSA
jgi:hypothetical protein